MPFIPHKPFTLVLFQQSQQSLRLRLRIFMFSEDKECHVDSKNADFMEGIYFLIEIVNYLLTNEGRTQNNEAIMISKLLLSLLGSCSMKTMTWQFARNLVIHDFYFNCWNPQPFYFEERKTCLMSLQIIFFCDILSPPYLLCTMFNSCQKNPNWIYLCFHMFFWLATAPNRHVLEMRHMRLMKSTM